MMNDKLGVFDDYSIDWSEPKITYHWQSQLLQDIVNEEAKKEK